MNASITYRGETYVGRSGESIVRRVWGRKAELRLSSDPNNRWGDVRQAMVTHTDRYGTHVLATVVVRDGS